MRGNPSLVRKSYVKTAVACGVLVVIALAMDLASWYWLPNVVAALVSLLIAVGVVAAALFAIASGVVLLRFRRDKLGRPDLFLQLNRSREPSSILAARPVRASAIRRWLAQRLLRHDLIVGDMVQVKSWDEIRATLDANGRLEELPFMPEMLAMCGKRAFVFRSVHRVFDYRKTRRMRHMDGAVLLVRTFCSGVSHGGCEATCPTIWKAEWLRRVDGPLAAQPDVPGAAAVSVSAGAAADPLLQLGTQGPRYTCQLTQLHAASQPIGNHSARNFFRPLVSGNVAAPAFVIGWLTHLFNKLQWKRGGVDFPSFELAEPKVLPPPESELMAGDVVVVRSPREIRSTLNEQMLNKGLYFEPDMMKHCGRRHMVQGEVGKLIDIVTGELHQMKTPAYILRDVHFSGERQQFNSQCEPLFWRSRWLRRTDG